jgi:hypothetical protein
MTTLVERSPHRGYRTAYQGSSQVPAGGKASCTVSIVASGTDAIATTCFGRSNITGSHFIFSRVVFKGTTKLNLATSSLVVTGFSVADVATVVETSGSGTLTGTVSRTGNGGLIATCQNLALVSGMASRPVHATDVGAIAIAGTYSGELGTLSAADDNPGSKVVLFGSSCGDSVDIGRV